MSVLSLIGGSLMHAAILPEDRADAMYHSYDGGGVKVDGPSILVRKAYKDKVSLWANYYVDMISSASIDVMSTASEYTEERTEYSVGVDYLRGKTFFGLSMTNSEEDDYSSDTFNLGISQDFFGDLSTLGLSYGYGSDTVRRNGDDVFSEKLHRQSYGVSFSQVITKSLLMNLTYSGITDEGFLNNPYRTVRYADPSSALGFGFEAEIYPNTRTSSAVALRGVYYLPYRAALKAEYRHFSDTWGIVSDNGEISYTHPLLEGITLDVRYRYYTQTEADFYSDLFPRMQAQNFLARDKELSAFTTSSFGLSFSYEFGMKFMPFFSSGELNLSADYIQFDYSNFRDITVGAPVGEEPFYQFNATVLRLFFSLRY
ncbi:MAG: DUF3570 domain-containing protein [Pseudomonadales bacterium]|nr:DUF3570 domain-containing protein [Pseudomonadales bacterium]